jgi:Alcohol dehydrogenase GroES-like domain
VGGGGDGEGMAPADPAGDGVKALVFRHSLAREAASAVAGRVDRRAFVSRFAPVRIEDVPELPLPAADWVRVRTTFSGLCGSDVKQILLNGSRDNPLTALVSFPHVLGHEVVGRRLDTGERVVLNPWLSCVPRGIDPVCPACLAGRYPWCRNFRSGDLPVSIHIGNCAAAAGAHAERFAAHVSQLFAIPSGVSDEAAALGRSVQRVAAVGAAGAARARPAGAGLRVGDAGIRGDRAGAVPVPGHRGMGGDAAGGAGPARGTARRACGAVIGAERARG